MVVITLAVCWPGDNAAEMTRAAIDLASHRMIKAQ
jgi:hypothetical protein